MGYDLLSFIKALHFLAILASFFFLEPYFSLSLPVFDDSVPQWCPEDCEPHLWCQ